MTPPKAAGEARRLAVLHLGDYPSVYVEGLFGFLEGRGESDGHVLVVNGHRSVPVAGTAPRWLVRTANRRAFLLEAARLGAEADKVVLHGLFDTSIMLLLAWRPGVRRKTCWIIWGGDLYAHRQPARSLRDRVLKSLRRFVVVRLPQVATHVPGDAVLCREWFGWRGEYLRAITYPHSVVRLPDAAPAARESGAGSRRGTGVLEADAAAGDHGGENRQPRDPRRVLAGNSAAPTNNHRDLFERLKRVDDGHMLVYCPLSYGPSEGRDEVAAWGAAAFGERFVPLLDMMHIDAYLDLLGSMDMAVFNHDRQAALGNILMLVGLGKRVYLKRGTTTWAHLASLGIKIFDVDDLALEAGFSERNANVQLVKDAYSEERLLEGLGRVFGPVGVRT